MKSIGEACTDVIAAMLYGRPGDPIPDMEIGLYVNPMARWYWLCPVEFEEPNWEGYQRVALSPLKWNRDTYKIHYADKILFKLGGPVAGYFLAREGRIFIGHEMREALEMADGAEIEIGVTITL